MHYAVILQFGTRDEERIIEYWRWINQNGGNDCLFQGGLKPHLTLSSFKNTDINILRDKLHEFADNTKKFKLTFDSISTFNLNPDVIYLKPNVTTKLEYIYKKFHRYFSGTINNINVNCLADNWMPHCAIGIKIKEDMTKQIVNDFKKQFVPLEVYIEKIAIIENNNGKRYIDEFALS